MSIFDYNPFTGNLDKVGGGPAGPPGPAGADGVDGADGATILSGSGAPLGGVGNVGDFYLDTDTGDFYEKTGVITWTFVINLKGPIGPAGQSGTIPFINVANLNEGKYLSLQQGAGFPSNENPFMIPFDGVFKALSFVNEINGISVDLQVRINGTVVLTWSLSNSRRAIKTNGLSGLTFVAGDKLSISAINVSNPKPRDVIVHCNLAYTSTLEQEITSPTL